MEIGSCSEVTKATAESASVCSSDIVTCSDPTVRSNLGLENSNLLTEIAAREDMVNKRFCEKVHFKLFERISVDSSLTGPSNWRKLEIGVKEP